MEQDIMGIKKKQNRKVTVFAVILSIISIGLLVAGFLLVSSDKVVMLQSLSNLTKKLETALDDKGLYDKIAKNTDLGIKGNISLTSEFLSLNGNISFDYLENKADKKSKIDLDLTIDNQNLLDINGVLANDNAYFFIKDITPKYYHTAFEYMSLINSLEGNDYDKISTILKDTVTDYIENDDIKKEKVEITYNGKAKNVNKLSYAITNKAIAEMYTNFTEAITKDTALIEKIAAYNYMTVEELKNTLNTLLKDMTYEKVEVEGYYNIYYYGFNKIVMYELVSSDNQPLIEYKVEDKETINLYDGEPNKNEKIFSLEVTNKKDQFTFEGFIKDTEDNTEIPFVGNLKDNTLTIVATQDGVDVVLAITSTEEVKDNSYITKNKIVLSGSSEGVEVTMGTLDINLELYFGGKVTEDITNSTDVNLITQEELNTIQTNLMNHPLYQLVMGMTGM